MVFMTLAGINFCHPFRRHPRRQPAGLQARSRSAPVLLRDVRQRRRHRALPLRHRHLHRPLQALRYAAFNTISIATTTGFANTDYALWPVFAPLWMLFLCSFITCAGSTGGGIKMMRAIILYKQVFRELLRSLHPHAVAPIKFGSEAVANQIIFAVLAFGFMYMVVLVS